MYSEYHKYTKYRSLDVYLNDTVYAPKGEDILTENTEWLFESMKEYPNEYVGFFDKSPHVSLLSFHTGESVIVGSNNQSDCFIAFLSV